MARAQQAGKPPTIGFLGSGTPTSQRTWVDAFVQRLRELGWIEGRTVAIDYRWAEGRPERCPRPPAAIVTPAGESPPGVEAGRGGLK